MFSSVIECDGWHPGSTRPGPTTNFRNKSKRSLQNVSK